MLSPPHHWIISSKINYNFLAELVFMRCVGNRGCTLSILSVVLVVTDVALCAVYTLQV